MKRIAIFCSSLLAAFVIITSAAQAQTEFGASLVYATNAAGSRAAGIEARLRFPDALNIRALMFDAGLAFYFPDNGTHIPADANLHFVLYRFRSGGSASVFGGLDLALDGASDAVVKVGVNLGGSLSYDVGPISLLAELKYVAGDLNRGVLTGGVLIPL